MVPLLKHVPPLIADCLLTALQRYSATRGPYQGLLLINPGGPGISAIDFLKGGAAAIQGIAGGNYDIVAWEPRGLGYSIPLANCSTVASTESKSRFMRRHDRLGNYFPEDYFWEAYEKAEKMGKECQTAAGGAYFLPNPIKGKDTDGRQVQLMPDLE